MRHFDWHTLVLFFVFSRLLLYPSLPSHFPPSPLSYGFWVIELFCCETFNVTLRDPLVLHCLPLFSLGSISYLTWYRFSFVHSFTLSLLSLLGTYSVVSFSLYFNRPLFVRLLVLGWSLGHFGNYLWSAYFVCHPSPDFRLSRFVCVSCSWPRYQFSEVFFLCFISFPCSASFRTEVIFREFWLVSRTSIPVFAESRVWIKSSNFTPSWPSFSDSNNHTIAGTPGIDVSFRPSSSSDGRSSWLVA